jgi:hypothetical protein
MPSVFDPRPEATDRSLLKMAVILVKKRRAIGDEGLEQPLGQVGCRDEACSAQLE